MVALGVSACTAEGLGTFFEQIGNRPVRKDVSTLDPDGPILAAYKTAIREMKDLPLSDPRNWRRQAEIHQNYCPHSNWLFLPWHRAYLYYFEKICQALAGMDDFALPYWNWSVDRTLPAPFADPSSELYYSQRRIFTLPDTAVGASLITAALNEPAFENIGSGSISGSDPQRTGAAKSSFEGAPHDRVHVLVGTSPAMESMSSFMSPLDPIFWLHHNMIDCIWTEWNFERRHPNPAVADWRDREFVEFVDETATPQVVSCFTTTLMPLLSYRFEATSKGIEGESSIGEPSNNEEAEELRAFIEEGTAQQIEVVEEIQGAGVEILPGDTAVLEFDVSIEDLLDTAEDQQLSIVIDIDVVLGEPASLGALVSIGEGAIDPEEPTESFLGAIEFFTATERELFCQIPGDVGRFRFLADEQIRTLAPDDRLTVTIATSDDASQSMRVVSSALRILSLGEG